MLAGHLRHCAQQMSHSSTWYVAFWQAVEAWHKAGMLSAEVLSLLAFHGYFGQALSSPPRIQQLLNGLEQLMQAAPAPGGLGFAGAACPSPAAPAGDGCTRWDLALAPDMRRAALEIYRSIRAAGHVSVRDYLNQSYKGGRDDHVWKDLWTQGPQIDFLVARAAVHGDLGIQRALASDDTLELGLRRIAAYVYEQRTRDTTGALVMQGVAPPGASVDIAPAWLVSESTLHSKYEHQRDERVAAARQRNWHKDKDKGKKGKGKGDDKWTPKGGTGK